jgi:uncharacterized cupredoxin-like copper-binding protein
MSQARPFLAIFPLAIALALSACGDEDREGSVEISGTDTSGTDTSAGSIATVGTTTEAAAPSGPLVATVNVAETDFKLTPANPTVSKTGVVEFKIRNRGQVTHALEVEGPEGERETDSIEPGRSATLKVDLGKRGSYEWYCPIGDHKERGMRGAVIVAGGGTETSEDAGGTTTSDDSGGSGSDDKSGY